MTTPKPPTPAPTGRRLVTLYVAQGHVSVSARDHVNFTPTPGTPALDRLYPRGSILPAGVSIDKLEHFARQGLAARVVVRI